MVTGRTEAEHKLSGKPSVGSVTFLVHQGEYITVGDSLVRIDYVEHEGTNARLRITAPSWMAIERSARKVKGRQRPDRATR